MFKSSMRVLIVATLLVSATTSCCGVVLEGPPPPAPCGIESLLVTESLFPTGWKEESARVEDAPARFGVEKIGKGFSSAEPLAIHQVYRATDASAAARGYEDFQSDFASRDDQSDWIVPGGLSYKSSIADEFRVGCAVRYPSKQERCLFIGHYGVYVVRFHTHMSPELMTYQDLERILLDIDRRMAECLR